MRRNILLFLMILAASALSLNCQTRAADEKAKPCKFLSFAEAEKILGRRVGLVTNSWDAAAGGTQIKCTYRGVEKDNGKEVNLYFMLEESADEAAAGQIYEKIWESNKNHQGIEILSGIGDEAYAHSDRSNFHFVMARRGKFTLRLKINKATETTSFDELKAFARKVIERI